MPRRRSCARSSRPARTRPSSSLAAGAAAPDETDARRGGARGGRLAGHAEALGRGRASSRDYRGRWTRAAAAHARIVARLREQGHSLEEIKEAGEDGRLAFGYVDELFPRRRGDVRRSSRPRDETGLEPALIERIWRGDGLPAWMLDRLDEEDLEALRYMAAVLAAGFPLVAFLQVMHVYGQSLRQIADAEARLFRIYVHEPLIRDGVPATQMAEEMGELIGELLPLTTPLMVYLHRNFLRHFVEQDVIANMESDARATSGEALGELRVAIVFADLVGFVRFTEEEGEQEALDLVESFVELGRGLAARAARAWSRTSATA